MPVATESLPCELCGERRERLSLHGFKVLGCTPDAGKPGFCTLSYEDPALSGGAAVTRTVTTESVEADGVAVEAVTVTTTVEPLASPQPAGATLAAAAALGALTPTQVRTAQAIVNLFETSEVLGDYGDVTLIEGDTGHLTYGRSQTTLGSGNLALLLQRYCGNPGARFGARLQPWLPRVQARDKALDQAPQLHNLLRAAADDPVMRETQDQFFDDVYWTPALRRAQQLGISSALGVAVVYDSIVHGSWGDMRQRTDAQAGSVQALGERGWIAAYVKVRRQWLGTHERQDLRRTVYRMDAFQRLIDQGFWGLPLPLVVRGKEISLASLTGTPPGCYDGPQPGTRALMLAQPLQRGLDVRLLQLGLSLQGVDIKADGLFGQASQTGLHAWQQAQGLPATGAADAALVAQLARV
ncbi:peptidoglycan-binding protein [Azohydromonas australica]|uniref:peptidoglycan-binding protein n=1 Tax=Azohydromonas australica TaxID=364039 RepID=UPI0004168356|nr:peptidoglycan-binding protein [Azohydromonas australica]